MQSNRSDPMNAPNAMKPRMQPFLPATADSPRQRSPRHSSSAASPTSRPGNRRSAPSSPSISPPRGPLRIARPSVASGKPLSPIDGMPIGIKDIIETIDMPTENGSPLFAGYRSERDAASVAALREAGAVIVGKTVTTEFAWMQPRATRNPWDLTRTPGGSSSGSAAAVAVGAISVGIGTQVFGSILRPSSFCGCFGFKPTVGAINRGGSHDALSQSTHGPLAASLPEAGKSPTRFPSASAATRAVRASAVRRPALPHRGLADLRFWRHPAGRSRHRERRRRSQKPLRNSNPPASRSSLAMKMKKSARSRTRSTTPRTLA